MSPIWIFRVIIAHRRYAGESGAIWSPFEADCVLGYGYGTHAPFIFAHYFSRWQLHARLAIRRGGGPRWPLYGKIALARMSRQGSYWSQSQAGLAIQPLVGLGFRWRWPGFGRDGVAVFASWAAVCKGFAAIRCHFASLRGRGPAVPAAILRDRRVFRRPFCSDIHHLALAAGDESGKICDRFSFEPIARSMIRI